jgi:hypothetical protein
MPGSFNLANLPKRAGAYFNFLAASIPSILPSVGDVLAVPFVHDWGPTGEVSFLGSFSDFVAIYGVHDPNQPGYRAVKQAFQGQGIPGIRGAGAVLGYRMSGSAGAQATLSLNNTTPAAALRVDALYKGTRGNSLRVSLRTNSNDVTKKDLVVLDGSSEIESWTYDPALSTPLARLAADVNGNSNWVALTVVIDTVALATVTSVPLAGGNDGATLVAGDWTAMMAGFEQQRFGYFAPFDLTDSSILTALKAWGQNLNTKGKRFFVVTGGALGETVTTAITRALSFNDPDFVTVGVGSIRDNSLLDANGNAVILSTAQFVPRLAGIMAQLGETSSLSGARVAGAELLADAATESAIDLAFDGGVIVLGRDSDLDAPVRIEKGLTTWTNAADADRPYKIFRTPKYVRTLHDLQMEFTDYITSFVIGKVQVNSATRSGVVGELSARMAIRESLGAVQKAWSVGVSTVPPPSDDDEFIALDIGLGFGRSAEQVLLSITSH